MTEQAPPLRVLVADDDRHVREVLRSLLGREGFQVEVAVNGREAIEKLRQEPYDLLLSDLKMPEVGGIEVLKACRQVHPEALVIIITGFASLETALIAIKEGAYDYIAKPFKLEEMLVVVRNAAEKIRLVAQNRKLIRELQEITEEVRRLRSSRQRLEDEREALEGRLEEQGDRLRERLSGLQPFPRQLLPLHYAHPGADPNRIRRMLEKLDTLHQQQVLTEEEYALLRRQLDQIA